MIKIEDLVYSALIKEVELTPKPGLVDKNNNGSHSDMNIEIFYASSKVIKPFMKRFYECGKNSLHVDDKILFQRLRGIGKECEKQMYLSTKGINTHKGIIFSFAVICGAIGVILAEEKTLGSVQVQDKIKAICEGLVQQDLCGEKAQNTHGEKFFLETKSGGIREEAQNGYPTIFQKSLPFYAQNREKYTENIALKLTLLFIMTQAKDSNLYARGGNDGLEFAKNKSKEILDLNDILSLDEKLSKLDEDFIEKNLSPGGSADLLCLTWFVFEVLSLHESISTCKDR
jgi:triphosphoribosyl-dephospho-CoA synthase CitG